MVYFVVADHAGGVKAADISKVFQPFYTSKVAGEGTGLGLSISYSIISEMGGTVTACNSDDGAVFEIRLPIPPKEQSEGADARLSAATTKPPQVADRPSKASR